MEKDKMSSQLKIGWLLEDDRPGNFIYNSPKPISTHKDKPLSPMAVQACPAVNNFESRYYEITCPFDLRLRCQKKEDKEVTYEFSSVAEGTRIDEELIKRNLTISPKKNWRNENRPVIQIECPYSFIADEKVYLTQLPPFLSFNSSYWPGTLISGRFNITDWPRNLSWAFEWHDLSQDLILKRNLPWFYVFFESDSPENVFKLVEAEYTDELRKFKNSMRHTPRYVSNTFSLFKTARQRRPKELLVEKKYE